MPVYEFRCGNCGRKFATLIGMVAGATTVACPRCGSSAAERVVSRVARFRSEDDRVDEIADRLETFSGEEPGGDMRNLMREMGHAMDDDAADDMEEMFEADMEGKLEDDE